MISSIFFILMVINGLDEGDFYQFDPGKMIAALSMDIWLLYLFDKFVF